VTGSTWWNLLLHTHSKPHLSPDPVPQNSTESTSLTLAASSTTFSSTSSAFSSSISPRALMPHQPSLTANFQAVPSRRVSVPVGNRTESRHEFLGTSRPVAITILNRSTETILIKGLPTLYCSLAHSACPSCIFFRASRSVR
jgi:hypothetical protein